MAVRKLIWMDAPLWIVIVAPVLAALAGGVLGALIQTSHARTAQLRENRIVAATDLSIGVAQTMIVLRPYWEAELRSDEQVAALRRARELADETVPRLTRVELMFDRKVRYPAGEMVAELVGAVTALEATPRDPAAAKKLAAASDHLGDFNDLVREEISTSRMRRFFARKSRSDRAQRI